MFQKDYIPTWLTLFLAIGIVIEFYFSINSLFILAVGDALFVLLILSWFYDQKRLIPSKNYFLISMLIFILIGIISVKIKTKDHRIDPVSAHRERKIFFSIDKILKESTYYHRFEAIILQIDSKKAKERILVRFLKDSLERPLPEVDDVFYTSAVLKTIDPPLNPYQFNYKAYLKTKQIFYQLRLNPEEVLKLNYRRNTLKGISHRIRKKINSALKRYHFTEEELSVINALLLGQRQNIDKELFEDYKNAGAVHILAISGLHIGIILFLLNFLLKPIEFLKRGKLIKLLLIIFLLWSFAFLAGLSASVVRAVSMFTAIAIGLFSNRKLSLINALVLSMFFLLLFHPFYLFDAGFQLSYLAVFFIITLQPFLIKIWHPRSKIIYYFWQLFTVSISAQIGVLPLSLYYFHRFPGLFFVSGMVIIPFLGLILGLGILVIILALLNILPDFIAISYGYLIDLMNRFISFISHQEGFIFYDISFSFVLMLLFYISLFFGLKLMIKRSFRNIIYFLL
ncbi:MAG: ComEC family competence protein, partial [Flavobacteriia bacterium]